NNPTEIAREAFRQLAARRIPPTPDNYRMLYAEISGLVSDADTFPEKEIKRLAHELSRAAPGQSRLERDLGEAIARRDWESVRRTLAGGFGTLAEVQQLAWSRLIGDLFRQWENKSADITPGKKREALDRALTISASNPRALFTRLENLQRAWARGEAANDIPLTGADLPESAPVSASPPSALVSDRMAVLPEMRELFAYALENCIAPLLAEQPRFFSEAQAFAQAVRQANSLAQLATMQTTLKQFAFRLALSIEDQTELRASLLKLLRLIVENIGELLQDDKWLAGQIEIVRDIVEKPLSQRALDDAEQRMKEVIFKQSQLKLSLQEAKDALKHMLSGFVDHLASFSGATSDYHDAMERCAKRVSAANNINELESVLAEVMQKTRAIQLNAQRSHDDLRTTQEKAAAAEGRVKALERELAQTSHLIRHDQLTGALNRRGLDDLLNKEIARAERHELPICLSLLDIDDFKKLNDSHGHAAGDEALIHLAAVIRESLRPQDTLARFGGEEFIIVFPETDLKEAVFAMTRLQRNLTRRIFLHENQRVLITFSAGIAQLQAGESQSSVIRRADAAMYESKKAGKNRVMVAAA
ncbi:MAG: diguanylate cyclase, partial [Zoogloeaceae bacterium]|nr:diguanylate cyclase [Zoogloeaceae bacterium]